MHTGSHTQRMGCISDHWCCTGWCWNQHTSIPIGDRSYMERNSIRRMEKCWKRPEIGWCLPQKRFAHRWIHYAQFPIERNQRSVPCHAWGQKYSQHYQFLNNCVIHSIVMWNIIANLFEALRFYFEREIFSYQILLKFKPKSVFQLKWGETINSSISFFKQYCVFSQWLKISN